jgi:hypothetical protein
MESRKHYLEDIETVCEEQNEVKLGFYHYASLMTRLLHRPNESSRDMSDGNWARMWV